MDQFAVIVAGGKGKRMGSEVPKQLLPLAGLPVILHTIRKFLEIIPAENIMVVWPRDEANAWSDLQSSHEELQGVRMVAGGAERFHSVSAGITALSGNAGSIAIHDGVRPLLSSDMIRRGFQRAEEMGSAVPVVALVDSIREVSGSKSVSKDRSNYVAVQTPQIFRLEELIECYQKEFSPSFTDDASVWEAAGKEIHLYEGEAENIKITGPSDLIIAEALMGRRTSN